ncbi:hypothetical protein POM88_043164 [Heracleum sosnowskyi]|uniref:Uncharacterized protein n=1 Tax=Heracleum sosnowskyi TaxID=360622 RepID=A0AAD8H2Y8_9APIA|nr:hypothetical protein POM88_043164 [Heracleum sosnowskyi]
MEVEEEGHKRLFVQLLNLYYIEQFALCGTKLQKPRPTSLYYVSNVDEFNKVNWASAIHELLMKSIEEAQMFLVGGRLGQNTFRGCAPVLEAILFERMPTLYSGSKRSTSPRVQSYVAQRKTVDVWKTSLLGCEVTACCHCCPSPTASARLLISPREGTMANNGDAPSEQEQQGLSSLSTSTSLITPPHSPIRLGPLSGERYEAISAGISALKLTLETKEDGRIMEFINNG